MSHVSPFDWSSLLADHPLIPVWASIVPDAADKVVETLSQAGYGVLEVTLREAAAWDVLQRLKTSELTLVAGSVRDQQQLQRLHDLGIRLAVTPGWHPQLCEQALQLGIRLLPGVSTPGEAMQASLLGYRQLKLFPATALGGPAYLRAMSAPLPELEFIPTGGLDESSMAQWFALPCVAALGGSWVLPRELVIRQDWNILGNVASRSLAAARELKLQQLASHQRSAGA